MDKFNEPSFEEHLDLILAEVRAEILRAKIKHPRTSASAHEAYAILLEEVDELWDEVKRDNLILARKEAVQVGAMAVQFLLEV